MGDLHGSLGSLVMPVAILVSVMSFGAFLFRTRRLGRALARIVDLAVIGTAALIVVAMGAGALIFIGGQQPQQILHLAYGVAALAAVPASAALGVRAEQRGGRSGSRYLWIAFGAFALVGLTLRLTQTGSV